MPPGTGELPLPSSNREERETAPVRDERWTRPRVPSLEEEPEDPEPWIAPAEAPARPCSDHTDDYEECAGVEGKCQQAAMNWLLVWEP